MQSKPIYDYIFFGASLRYLFDARAGDPVHGKTFILENIDKVLARLKEYELPVTQRAASELYEFRDKLAKSVSKHTLTADESLKLGEIMQDVRKTLSAESKGKVAFIVTDKRIDVNKLLSDVPGLMAPGVFNSLPEIAKHDFMEAGKCIAFELPTAAAFHLLRGTESVLRELYCSIVRKRRVELLWYHMVGSLRKRRTPLPAPLLDHLDHIRQNFRNPTQHPEKIYDIQEVQNLFHLCVDAVDRMVKLITKSQK